MTGLPFVLQYFFSVENIVVFVNKYSNYREKVSLCNKGQKKSVHRPENDTISMLVLLPQVNLSK